MTQRRFSDSRLRDALTRQPDAAHLSEELDLVVASVRRTRQVGIPTSPMDARGSRDRVAPPVARPGTRRLVPPDAAAGRIDRPRRRLGHRGRPGRRLRSQASDRRSGDRVGPDLVAGRDPARLLVGRSGATGRHLRGLRHLGAAAARGRRPPRQPDATDRADHRFERRRLADLVVPGQPPARRRRRRERRSRPGDHRRGHRSPNAAGTRDAGRLGCRLVAGRRGKSRSPMAGTTRRSERSTSSIPMGRTSGRLTTTTSRGAGFDTPVWSPDGARIAFASETSGADRFQKDIWTVGLDGSPEVDRTNDPADELGPSWSTGRLAARLAPRDRAWHATLPRGRGRRDGRGRRRCCRRSSATCRPSGRRTEPASSPSSSAPTAARTGSWRSTCGAVRLSSSWTPYRTISGAGSRRSVERRWRVGPGRSRPPIDDRR